MRSSSVRINIYSITLIICLYSNIILTSAYLYEYPSNINCRQRKVIKNIDAFDTKLYADTKENNSGKRKRRSKVSTTDSNRSLTSNKINNNEFSKESTISTTSSISKNNPSSTSSSIINFNINDFDEELIKQSLSASKLPPLAGTIAEKQAIFNEKNAIQRYFDDVFTPTPVGQEPKLSQLAKSITWGAVLLLVITEIFVSIKVGGMPFDLSGNAQLIPVSDKPVPSLTTPME